jgi:UDPglucose 6-dehydrogenase
VRIGFVGLGKLGFPCAVALGLKGHEVLGYDSDSGLIEGYRRGEVTPFEPGLGEQYASCRDQIHYCQSVQEVVERAEVIFVAVPTPHAPTHDGSRPYDGTPRDFDNGPITDCLEQIGSAIGSLGADAAKRTILVISTVTPGTTARELAPAVERASSKPLGKGWTLVYNPFFIGQSTVVRDFLNPEFVLLGCPPGGADAGEGERVGRELYGTLHSQPMCPMTWTEAECVKLAYNTYLGLKVIFANTIMELCHKLPDASCDVVNATLKLATDRLISSKYMDGGMADGGPCHGRDQMAMSYTAQQAGLAFNIFDVINNARDTQTEWLADLAIEHARGRPIVLLGMAFKPDTNQTQGSPALLLANILRAKNIEPILHDPVLAPDAPFPQEPALYVISTRWSEYRALEFREGDTVIDPWRMIDLAPAGVELIGVGAGTGPEVVTLARGIRPMAAAG